MSSRQKFQSSINTGENIMYFGLSVFTIVNTFLLGWMLILSSSLQESRISKYVDEGAIIAVREKLQTIDGVTTGTPLRIHGSCAQQRDDYIAVVGRADVQNDASLADGSRVSQSTQLSFRARVNTVCNSVYNPNCYDVERLDIEGQQNVTPLP
jgi:hypothetical protein